MSSTQSERIIQAFNQATGHELVESPPLREELRTILDLPVIETLSSGRLVEKPDGTHAIERDPQLAKLYGEFLIFICDDRKWRDHRLSDGTLDADGIYWHEVFPERQTDSSYWIAEKPYGKSVLLSWVSESGSRKTSSQWDRLDALLRSSVQEQRQT